jgi:alpha-tubulin suppressor-like RCC1 family protein
VASGLVASSPPQQRQSHTAAKASSAKPGSMVAFGSSQFGQLGLGQLEATEATPKPSEYLARVDVARVYAGGDSSAALTADGTLFTFGAGGNSRLGHGGDSLDTPHVAMPQRVPELPGAVAACAVGEYHMAALLTAEGGGHVYTWGRARAPQLGHANAKRGAPNRVLGLGQHPAVAVACGRQQTAAVTADGALYTWGIGFEGSLGHGSKVNEAAPKRVMALEGEFVSAVACGRDYTLALTREGALYAWGANDYGQLGLNLSVKYQRSPLLVGGALAGRRVVAVAAGDFHVAALTEGGEVFTWGLGKEGQLGHGNRDALAVPRRVEALEGAGVTAVACGGGHTAALDGARQLWLFGRGRSGQLGRGDQLESIAAYRPLPTLVTALAREGADVDVLGVSLGHDHTLALVKPRK